MSNHFEEMKIALKMIFDGIDRLRLISGNQRQFTIDGRLVGDLGEIIAAQEFDITLDQVSREGHDAVTADGKKVQIKCTFQNNLTFRQVPELYLGLKLFRDGTHEVVFNGPGSIIAQEFQHRQGFGRVLLSFPIARLKELSKGIEDQSRVPPRKISDSI